MAEETPAVPPSAPTPAPAAPSVAPKPKDPGMYVPLYVITGLFAAVFIFVPFLFRKGPNKGIIRCSIMIAAFSMWLFWVTMYIAQMNPLLGPRLHNETLAWVSHTWGKKLASGPVEGGGEAAPGGGEPEPGPAPGPEPVENP